MSAYRTLDEVSVDYFTQHPEEIEEFPQEIFADYAQDGDSVALLSALCIIGRVRSVSALDLLPDGLRKIFSNAS